MSVSQHLLGQTGKWMFGSITPRRFLSHLEDHLSAVLASEARAKEMVAQIRTRWERIVEEDRDLIVDGPSEGMLTSAACVLAAYETLLSEIGDPARTIAFVQHVFVESVEHMSSLSTGLLFRSGKDSEKTIERFMSQLTAMYGKGFDFEFERTTEDGERVFEMRVTRCFFKEFFERHGLREVTTVLCAADSFWMDQIDPPLMGVRSERTALMSLGDDVDRFRIVETHDPAATNTDVLKERRLP